MAKDLGELLLTGIFMAGNLVPNEFFKIQKLASAEAFPQVLGPALGRGEQLPTAPTTTDAQPVGDLTEIWATPKAPLETGQPHPAPVLF